VAVNHPEIIAHRGASADAPENTVAAFNGAWKQNADGIEGDFRLCLDGTIICMHDATLERTAGDPRPVTSISRTDLDSLEVGSWMSESHRGEPIPELACVLETVPPGKRVFIEVKSGPGIIPALVAGLDDSSLDPSQLVIIAFDEGVIRAAKAVRPDLACLLLESFKEDGGAWHPTITELISRAAACGANGLGVQARVEVVDADFVQECHAAGLELNVWTVDSPEIARVFAECGVDTITTNQPALIREALRTSDD
jgi:glycerophosphoryl diester phosphodiesterase